MAGDGSGSSGGLAAPEINPSDLNIILAIFGLFIILYGLLSVKIKNKWYLGEALPAVAMGVLLGPVAAKFIVADRWGGAEPGQVSEITLGFMRVMIGIQLVIAGYQLPAKYQMMRWKEMLIILIPIMSMMWLSTTVCILAVIPKVSLLAAMAIAACVTSTDPVLSQAIAKGPFADKYVARPVREIISSEAGGNDGFGFPFLMLATYLMRHAEGVEVMSMGGEAHGAEGASAEAAMGEIHKRAGAVDRQGGGVGLALGNWALLTMVYVVALGAIYGAVCGTLARYAIKYSLRRKWIDSESYLLAPLAIGLTIIGTAGAFGSNDLLACFAAGSALNWDGEYLAETLKRHDEVNSSLDVLLNFSGFMYLGTIMPWNEFNSELTGINYGRLIGLGFLVLIFRRIPAIMITYKLMPSCIRNWKEALFMGYFGPIGVGAAFYVEHTQHLFPKLDSTNDTEVNDLLRALRPTVYWLALFSIVVHGLSIPLLDFVYTKMGVKPIQEDAVELRRKSIHIAAPSNAIEGDKETFIAYNRFSRPVFDTTQLPDWRDEDSSPKMSNDVERQKTEAALSGAPRSRSRSRSMIRFADRR